jgi:hypothetical protein
MAAASASLPRPARSKPTPEPPADLAPDLFFVNSEGAWAETPLTSEPPLSDAEPLTSESATIAAPLTSEAAAFADPDSTRP